MPVKMGGACGRRRPLSLDRSVGRHCLLAARARRDVRDARRRPASRRHSRTQRRRGRRHPTASFLSALGWTIQLLRPRDERQSGIFPRSSYHFVAIYTPSRFCPLNNVTRPRRRDAPLLFIFSTLKRRGLVKKPATCARLVLLHVNGHTTPELPEGRTSKTSPPRTADLATDAAKYVYSTECAINQRSVGNWWRGTENRSGRSIDVYRGPFNESSRHVETSGKKA